MFSSFNHELGHSSLYRAEDLDGETAILGYV